MYRSNKEIIKVIKNENIIDVLCGKEPYEVECSRFTSDVFPTDINAVLVNYIYNIKLKLIFSFCHFVIVICHIVTFIIITSKRLASFLDVTKKGESANITCTCKI